MKGGWCLVYGPLFIIWDVKARVEGGGSRAEGRWSRVEGSVRTFRMLGRVCALGFRVEA